MRNDIYTLTKICFKIKFINRDPMEEIMQAYSYYRPTTGRALHYSNFGRDLDEQLSPGESGERESVVPQEIPVKQEKQS